MPWISRVHGIFLKMAKNISVDAAAFAEFQGSHSFLSHSFLFLPHSFCHILSVTLFVSPSFSPFSIEFKRKNQGKAQLEKEEVKKTVDRVNRLLVYLNSMSTERKNMNFVELGKWQKQGVEGDADRQAELLGMTVAERELDRQRHLKRIQTHVYLYDRRICLENVCCFSSLDMNIHWSKQKKHDVVEACKGIEQFLPSLYESRAAVRSAVQSRFNKIKQKVNYTWQKVVKKETQDSDKYTRLFKADINDSMVSDIDARVRENLGKSCRILGKLWSSVFSQSSAVPRGQKSALVAW